MLKLVNGSSTTDSKYRIYFNIFLCLFLFVFKNIVVFIINFIRCIMLNNY